VSSPEDNLCQGFGDLLRFEVGIVDELVELRLSGYEPPLNAAVVQAAGKRVKIRWVLEMVRQDRRWVLAWFLARYLDTVQPTSGRISKPG
jgi:hypothetical protein